MPMTVFVTDGDERPALAIVRALGRRGVRTIVGDERAVNLASTSKYCSRRVAYPSPYDNCEAFEQFLLDFVARERVDVLLPVTDVTTRAVCALQEQLGRRTALAVPPFDAFEAVTDKGTLAEHANRCGVPVPRTCAIEGIESLDRVIDRFEYPVVVKPVRSRLQTARGWMAGSVHYARSARELRDLYARHEYLAAHPSLVQQRIVGPGIGVFVLFNRGELLETFAHRRLREKPPAGGASVLCESQTVPDSLRGHAVSLLGSLGWHGVAMMEYKQDHRTGEFFLMEVNGRFWGSLQLAIDAGIDFPRLVCELALGHRPQLAEPYAVGVRSRWLLGDLDHLIMRLFKSDRSLQLPGSAPSRVRALVDFVASAADGSRDGIRDVADPRPFLHELRRYVGEIAASAARRVLPAPSGVAVDR